MKRTIVDFMTKVRTMRLADPEDRALLGSNSSAAVGDGDIDRSTWYPGAPVPRPFDPNVLVRKAKNPLSLAGLTEFNRLQTPTGMPYGNI
jgi:hypothetical protein